MEAAITREKQLKKWNRDWKLRLIEESNPEWVDLGIGLGLPPVGRQREWIPASAGITDQ